jgi:hypothetical protein
MRHLKKIRHCKYFPELVSIKQVECFWRVLGWQKKDGTIHFSSLLSLEF